MTRAREGLPGGEAPRDRGRRLVTWALWLAILAAVATILFALRESLDKAHVALGLLVVVLGASAAGGRALGVALAVLAFFVFNYFFLEPFHTFAVADPLDWLVLVAFLITGVVAAQLLDRAQERAETAQRRALEVERLAALGAETLNVGRAEDALFGVAEVIRTSLAVDTCEVLVARGGSTDLVPLVHTGRAPGDAAADGVTGTAWSLAAWVAERRAVAAERPDGTKWIGTGDGPEGRLQWPPEGVGIRALLVPLTVRERAVGVLRVSHATPFELDPDRAQFLSALSYYAALGVERLRLVAEAERAEAFRQADALKASLIAGVSHDLRTPLTTIKALAQSLRQRGGDHTEAASIEEEADRLNRLVADLLDLSRLNAGAMPMRLELNTAEDLIGAARQRVTAAFGGRRILVGSAGDAGALVVGRFDFVQSLRALVNLLENAHKYSPVDAPIDVSVVRNGSTIEISVSDRGPGIPAEERERIFEPFYRAPGAAADVGGAGLGLAIARRLAEEQGGALRYEPRRNGGSVFTLRLPAADASAEMPTEATGASMGGRVSPEAARPG